MDQGPDSKRPRHSPAGTSWPSGPPHHSGPLPKLAPPPQSPSSVGHHPTAPNPYQPTPFSSRSSDPPPLPFPNSTPMSQPPPSHSQPYDRRHHDSDQYHPTPDHRPHYQPPPSPAQGQSYSPYQRDAPIKRESEGPVLPRPQSTGNVPENSPPGAMSLSHHSGPPSSHPDDRRHTSFDSGALPPLVGPPHQPHGSHAHPQPPPPPPPPGSNYGPMHAPRPPYAPPTTLPPQSQQYDHNMFSPHEPMSFPYNTISTAKRKAQRASQACDMCRSLKAKCDETKPCKNCKDKGLDCKYRDPVPKQQDKVANDILEMLTELRAELQEHRQHVDARFNSVEKAMGQASPSVNFATTEPATDSHRATSAPPPDDQDTVDSPPGDPMETDIPATSLPRLPRHEVQRALNEFTADEYRETTPGETVPPDEPAIPAKHTTLATTILTWPPVREKVGALLAEQGVEWLSDYPIGLEERRGTIRLFGRGDGHERAITADTREHGEYPVNTNSAFESIDDHSSDASSSPQGDYYYGQTGGFSPGAENVQVKGTPLINNDLNFADELVDTYVDSYLKNIQNMHPLIFPKDLKAMVQHFQEHLPASRIIKGGPGVKARFLASMAMEPEAPGSKRKRSPAAEVAPPNSFPVKPGKPYRTVTSALILLVLALGKICLVKDRLNDVVPTSESNVHPSPHLLNGHPVSPAQGSPPSLSSHSQSSTLPSPKTEDRSLPNRRFSQSGQPAATSRSFSLRRNIDSIPGLEYYAVATDIIGNHVSSVTLKYAWCNILACLYESQVVRPVPAFERIVYAGRTVLALLRPHMKRFKEIRNRGPKDPGVKELQTRRDNQLAVAFWSCTQLESDLLAELPIQPSGILERESQMPYPNMTALMKDGLCEDDEGFSYIMQLHFRKGLNMIHRELYDANPTKEPMKDVMMVVINQAIPPRPKKWDFEENAEPATDILHARLRAKYYGARGITYRPFIQMILNFNYRQRLLAEGKDVSHLPLPDDRLRPGINVPRIHDGLIPREMINYAASGIAALKQSTRAFHNLPEKRFIVTNIFGTAHAQWGNLLILEACSRDPVLSDFVKVDQLLPLFERTIEFFKVIQQPRSTMLYDLRSLEGLARDLRNRKYGGSDYVRAMTSPHAATPGAVPYMAPMMGTPTSDAGPYHSPPGPHPYARGNEATKAERP